MHPIMTNLLDEFCMENAIRRVESRVSRQLSEDELFSLVEIEMEGMAQELNEFEGDDSRMRPIDAIAIWNRNTARLTKGISEGFVDNG